MKMGQQEVYKILKINGEWMLSREISDKLKDNIGAGNLSRNIKRLIQSGLIKSKFIKGNVFMYKVE